MEIKHFKVVEVEISDYYPFRKELIVTEYEPNKWYAQFKDVGTASGAAITFVAGYGKTPDEAISDYAQKISNQELGMLGNNRELAPKLIHTKLVSI